MFRNNDVEIVRLSNSNLDKDAELATLRAENEMLRDALSFYADASKYIFPLTGGLGDLYFDCGSVAKEALK